MQEGYRTGTFIICKWQKHQDCSQSWLPSQSEQLGQKSPNQQVIKNPSVHSHRTLWSWENLPEGQPFLQHSTNQHCMVEWPNGNHCSVKWQNMEQVKRCQYTVDLRNCIFCSTKHTFSHESKRLTPVLSICVRYTLRMHFLPFCFQNQGMKIVFLVLNNQMCQKTVNLSLFH